MARIAIEDRRESLVRAAIAVIGTRGVAAATTRTIVAEAGASLASFHYAFASRDELMADVIRHVIADEQRLVHAAIAPSTDLRALIHGGLTAYVDSLVAHPERELAALELTWFALRTPGLELLAADQYVRYRELAAEMLELAAEWTGIVWRVPVDELAGHLVVLTDGITTAWLADRDVDRAARAVDFAADALVAYADRVAS